MLNLLPSQYFPERRYARAGMLILLSLGITSVCLVLDARSLDGEPIWLKPIKFQISVGLFYVTLAFFSQWADRDLLENKRYTVLSNVMIAAGMIELAWILVSAGLGIRSHYNTDSTLMTALYAAMGVVVLIMLAACLVTAWLIHQRHKREGWTPLAAGIVASLVLTFILTTWSAGTLAESAGPIFPEGVEGINPTTIPLLGWSTVGGDVKVSHFFATHAMHVIPLVLWLFYTYVPFSRRMQFALIVPGTLIYATATGLVYFQALQGHPFISASL